VATPTAQGGGSSSCLVWEKGGNLDLLGATGRRGEKGRGKTKRARSSIMARERKRFILRFCTSDLSQKEEDLPSATPDEKRKGKEREESGTVFPAPEEKRSFLPIPF